MGILSINVNTAGLVGSSVNPRRCTMVTTDNLAAIVVPGYLNNQQTSGNNILPTDVFDIIYSFNQTTQNGIFARFTITYAVATGYTLVPSIDTANILFPVVNNNFAAFNGTSGQIKDSGKADNIGTMAYENSNTVAITGGTIAGTAITGGTVSGLSAPLAITDGGTAAITPTAALNNLQCLRSFTAPWAGGSNRNTFVATGLHVGSIVTASIFDQTNNVSITGVTPGEATLTVAFSADPGLETIISWIGFNA